MQLPRGTFREIRRSVAIESLLRELDGEKFSGVASISSPSLTGTLAFKAGKCILIKIQNSRGDAAWDDLVKAGNEEVDAALSLLGDAQIELALEFNKPCRLVRAAKHATAPAAPRPAPAASREQTQTVHAPRPAGPVAPLKPPTKPVPTHRPAPAPPATPKAPGHAPPPHPSLFTKTTVPVPPSPQAQAPPRETGKQEEEEQSGKEHEATSFESDLDTFDTMDIDNVTDKIRTDCKTMIKQLHLDHLMER
jgi:hypothetical protein